MNPIFIGFDGRQVVSYTVLQTSIVTRTDKPVAITPLIINQLPLKRTGLTPFTFSRFLVPHLCHYEGLALFLDADILVLDDIDKLFQIATADPSKAVWVRQSHMRFEWASVMLFNCGHPDNRRLSPEYIETADKLHGIGWTDAIGDLPPEWNHLVGYDPPRADAKLVHFTQGVPAWPETEGTEYSDLWRQEARVAMHAEPWAKLMGTSVHAIPVIRRLVAQGKMDPEILDKLPPAA